MTFVPAAGTFVQALVHARIAESVTLLADLERAVPRLIDRLASLYLVAVSSDLDPADWFELKSRVDEARRDLVRCRERLSSLKQGAQPLKSWEPEVFDAVLAAADRGFAGFDIGAFRRRPEAGQKWKTLILDGAREWSEEFADLIRAKLSEPAFPGSEGQKALDDLLGYFSWDRPVPWPLNRRT